MLEISSKCTLRGQKRFNKLLCIRASLSVGVRCQSSLSKPDYSTVDGSYENDRIPRKPGDPNRRAFTYFVLGSGQFIYASVARVALMKVGLSHNIRHLFALSRDCGN
jgi:hypothetical protein